MVVFFTFFWPPPKVDKVTVYVDEITKMVKK
jgi:hypothetical protein